MCMVMRRFDFSTSGRTSSIPLRVVGVRGASSGSRRDDRCPGRAAAGAGPGRCRPGRGSCRPGRPARRGSSSGGGDCAGSTASQAPQPWPTRGTPPDEPQPRIVTPRIHAAGPHHGHAPHGGSHATSGSRGILSNRRRTFAVVVAGDLLVGDAARLGQKARGVRHEGGLVALAAMRASGARNGASVSTRIRSAGTRAAISRKRGRVLEGQDTRKRDRKAERDGKCRPAPRRP